MYEALQRVSDDLQTLSKNLTTTALEKQRIDALCSALATTAEELDQEGRLSTMPSDRANLAKLYQGMLAAKRLVEHLYEQERATASAPMQHFAHQPTLMTPRANS